jgi:hypothetical protein
MLSYRLSYTGFMPPAQIVGALGNGGILGAHTGVTSCLATYLATVLATDLATLGSVWLVRQKLRAEHLL